MYKSLGKFLLGIILLSFNSSSSAQEVESFLACGEIPDRVERVLCLETALEQTWRDSALHDRGATWAAERQAASTQAG